MGPPLPVPPTQLRGATAGSTVGPCHEQGAEGVVGHGDVGALGCVWTRPDPQVLTALQVPLRVLLVVAPPSAGGSHGRCEAESRGRPGRVKGGTGGSCLNGAGKSDSHAVLAVCILQLSVSSTAGAPMKPCLSALEMLTHHRLVHIENPRPPGWGLRPVPNPQQCACSTRGCEKAQGGLAEAHSGAPWPPLSCRVPRPPRSDPWSVRVAAGPCGAAALRGSGCGRA